MKPQLTYFQKEQTVTSGDVTTGYMDIYTEDNFQPRKPRIFRKIRASNVTPARQWYLATFLIEVEDGIFQQFDAAMITDNHHAVLDNVPTNYRILVRIFQAKVNDVYRLDGFYEV